jgi:hypothetical protein
VKTNRLAIAALLFASLLFAPASVLAQRTGGQTEFIPAPIVTEIVIPGTPVAPGEETAGRLVDLAQYIGIIYNFLISIVGMMAAIMFVIGGFQYVTSAGDQGKIGAAKKRITDALIGMVLALGAYTLLNTINPALLTLKLPGGISGVRQEVTFLPFCDDLAKQRNISEDDIIKASGTTHSGTEVIPDINCGSAGFIKSQIKNSDGTMTESRVWCIWRGNKVDAKKKQAAGEYVNDYGCADDTSIGGERVIGTLSIHALSVCAPDPRFTAAQLNEEYDKAQTINSSLGRCISCNEISDGRAQNMGWPVGDQSCEYWQNLANNGDAKNNDFKYSKKAIMQDTRFGGVFGQDDRSRRMYYCGYSNTHNRCIYVPVLCHRVSECDSYDSMVMNYCEKTDSQGSITCHASQTLGSSWGTQAGNAAHLIPICEADPCEKAPTGGGCEVGGLAGTRNTFVGRTTGGSVRMGLRVITGGLAGSISCDAKK